MRRVLFALIAAGAIAMFAAPAGAAPGDTITVTGGSPTGTINGTYAGQAYSVLGGVVQTTGGVAYCADFSTLVTIGAVVDQVPWDDLAGGDLSAGSLPVVAAITNYEFPQDQGFSLEGTDQDKAAGVQAALWHFTNGFELSGDNSAALIANYNTILARVANKEYPSLKPRVLTITPASSTGTTNLVAGPFTLTSSLGDATVTASDGAQLTDANGDALASNQLDDGAKFYVKSANAGAVTLTAVAQVPQQSALAFNTEGIQRLVAAQILYDPMETTAEITFAPPSTSVGPNTTVRPPSTSVGPNPTTGANTTAAVQVQAAQVSGSLPRTGGGAELFPYAVGLVGLGLLLVSLQWRQREIARRVAAAEQT